MPGGTSARPAPRVVLAPVAALLAWGVLASSAMAAGPAAGAPVPAAAAQAAASASAAGAGAGADSGWPAPQFTLQVDHGERLAGLRRVVIASFQVQFMTELRADARIDGQPVIAGAPGPVKLLLSAVDPAQLQAVVDALHDQVVRQLQAVGLEVLPAERQQAEPAGAELARQAAATPGEEDSRAGRGLFVSARGLPLRHADELAWRPPGPEASATRPGGRRAEDSFLPLSARLAASTATADTADAEARLAQALDAAVLSVRLTVAGGLFTPDDSHWTGPPGRSPGAAVLPPLVNRFAFVLPDGERARVALRVPARSDLLGELEKFGPNGLQAVDVARHALNAALVLGGARALRRPGRAAEHLWWVEPAQYARQVQAQLTALTAAFSQQLSQPLRQHMTQPPSQPPSQPLRR